MRNLKKILALALALVMSMSLMATANAFTDDDSITDTYDTAVTVLSELKVFQGYDEGDFRPQGAITRAEVAAILYRIVTGDVADTQVDIYADYNKFDDVKSTSWYAGYVNFCANAEYIKGYDAKTFGPNDRVTGYQALAMILRALGYDKNGEFTGTNWHIQTAAVGEQRGITKNITAGTLGVPATREVVAEILFRAILVDTVNYTPAFGYQIGDTSLGYKTFGLEEITGVVTANEYADLYDDHTQKAGKTVLDVDGEDYTIDYTTTLEDIGESRSAYITGSTVLAIGDSGLNTVFETGADTDIGTPSKFENITGMERSGVEYFVNFDGGTTYKASDWRIEYYAEFDQTDLTADEDAELKAALRANGGTPNFSGTPYTYTKTIRPEAEISDLDMDIMKGIFYDGDLNEVGGTDVIVAGEIYVGTQSKEDISDSADVSWKSFVNEYITTGENSQVVEGNENGNWLKVVDNDGDGEADVVMKTIYTFAGVEDIDRNGNIELTVLDANLDNDDELNEIDDDIAVVTADEISEGDIVYYAVIDGNAQTYLAEMVTAEIDKVNRKDLIATTTDGDEYGQSGVHNHVLWTDPVFEDGVKNLAGGVSYDLYLDKYGYLGVFVETATSGNFVLLTDGWYNETKTADEYSVKAYIDGEIDIVDVDSGASLFIYDDNRTQNNSWGNLKHFGDLNATGTDVITTVASLSEDGDLTAVGKVFNRRTIEMIDMAGAIVDRDGETGTLVYDSNTRGDAYTAGTAADRNVEVRALSTTVYYYVYMDGRDTVVNEYVGYANTPNLSAADKAHIEDSYAVATRVERANGDVYYTADVVVVEFDQAYKVDAEVVFVYDFPVVGNNVGIEYVSVIREDGTVGEVQVDLSEYRDYDPAYGKRLMPGLFYLWDTRDEGIYTIERMTPDEIADAGFAIGTVRTSIHTFERDWAEISVNQWSTAGALTVLSTPEYKNVEDSSYYSLSYSDVDVDSTGRYGDWNVTLDDGVDAEDVLDETVTENKHAYDNRVLVSYNSDDEIIYAISFAHTEGSDLAEDNFALNVWSRMVLEEQVTLTYLDRAKVIIDENGALNGTHTIAEAEALLTEATTYWNRTDVTTDAKNELETSEAITYLEDAIADYYKAQLNAYVADPELTDDQKTEVNYAAQLATQSATVTDKASFDAACVALDAFCQTYLTELAAAKTAAVTALTDKADDLKSSYKDMATDINAALAAETAKVEAAETKAAVGTAKDNGIAALEAVVEDEATNDDKNLVAAAAAIVKANNWAPVVATLTEEAWENALQAAIEAKVNNVEVAVSADDWTDPDADADGEVDVTFTVTLTANNATADEKVVLTVTSEAKQDANDAATAITAETVSDIDDSANWTMEYIVGQLKTAHEAALTDYNVTINCDHVLTSAETIAKEATISYTVTITLKANTNVTATSEALEVTVNGTWA